MTTFTIIGPPRTKKSHSRIIRAGGRPRIIPSAAHEEWYRVALPQAIAVARCSSTITYPVNVAAVFFRDRAVGDAVGYYQALGDLLERAGIIENDRLIASWDGSRLGKDAQRPRIEVAITAVEASR